MANKIKKKYVVFWPKIEKQFILSRSYFEVIGVMDFFFIVSYPLFKTHERYESVVMNLGQMHLISDEILQLYDIMRYHLSFELKFVRFRIDLSIIS